MKIIFLGFCVILLYGCSLSAYTLHEQKGIDLVMEDKASLHIVVDDKAYGEVLTKVWNTTYPKHKDVLSIQVKPYTFSQHIEGDIVWVKDSDVMYKIKEAYDLSNMNIDREYDIYKELEKKERKDVFVPIEGKGLLFAYNEQNLKLQNGNKKDLESMEGMKKIKKNAYYHNRKSDYVYPFIFQEYAQLKKEEASIYTLFQDDVFQKNLEDYKNMCDRLSLRDGVFDMNTFYEKNAFVSGLLDINGDYQNSRAYKQGTLHFSSMPNYRNKKLSPIVDTYGFMVHKNVKYPGATKAFLQMVRSKEGMQSLLKETKKYPLLEKEDIADFAIFDVTKKEIIAAMNDSQLRSTLTFLERPSITFHRLYNKSDFLSILQNYTYTKQSAADIQKALIKEMKQWVLRK